MTGLLRLAAAFVVACGSAQEAPDAPASPADLADVIDVQVTGAPQSYRFAVTVSSPDSGCDAYADWWEVVSDDGRLLYRRVLLHSHVDEQPFSRSGAPIPIAADEVVWLRAHMHPGGYGGLALNGSVQGGFEEQTLSADFAADLAAGEPLPTGCDF